MLKAAAFPIPRVVRSKGYRSKTPGREAVSSSVFSYADLMVSSRSIVEARGTVADVPSQRAGMIAAVVNGGRVVR
jgi:hypothetical protein